MNTPPHGRFLFRYLAVLTTVSVALIGLNVLLGMQIPFAVGFLIAYVGALMVFVVWHAYLTKGWWQSLRCWQHRFSSPSQQRHSA